MDKESFYSVRFSNFFLLFSILWITFVSILPGCSGVSPSGRLKTAISISRLETSMSSSHQDADVKGAKNWIDDTTRAYLVGLHNRYRMKESPFAEYMLAMRYDYQLEAYARWWAGELCSSQTGKPSPVGKTTDGSVSRPVGVGEITISSHRVMVNYEDAMDMLEVMFYNMYNEKNAYDWEKAKSEGSDYHPTYDVDHYTQIVQSDANAFGCGFLSNCPGASSTRLVCHYNFINRSIPYTRIEVPKTCSKCPDNYSECGDVASPPELATKGLCKGPEPKCPLNSTTLHINKYLLQPCLCDGFIVGENPTPMMEKGFWFTNNRCYNSPVSTASEDHSPFFDFPKKYWPNSASRSNQQLFRVAVITFLATTFAVFYYLP